MRFQKATKFASKLRLAFIGPAGSGKTYSALACAVHLVPGGRVAVIDTERGSASKYADQFAFDVCNLDKHSPQDYVSAIRDAEQAGYDVIVIDSLSHAWSGRGGALEMVDRAAQRSRTGNTFGAWREVTPVHNEMVDAIVGCKAHVIVTMRAKTEWVQEADERGKTRIRKVGLAPVQRDGLEYEFDVVGDIDADHNLAVTKTRCSALAGALLPKPGEQFAAILREWLQGAPAPASVATPPQAATPAPAAQDVAAVAPKVEAVLAAFQAALTEAQLLEAGAMARTLPASQQAVARKAYANRLRQIQWRATVSQTFGSLSAQRQQSLVDQLGASGIIVEAFDKMPDESVEAIEQLLNQENETDEHV